MIDEGSPRPLAPANSGLRGGDHYPIGLDLTGRLVLVVGGGPVAARKAARVLEAGGRVVLIAPQVCEAAELMAKAGEIDWRAEEYVAGTLASLRAQEPVWLVHTATGTPADDLVAAEADADGVWCIRADDASRTRAWNPAVAAGAPGSPADGITVAITEGGDPRRAMALRDAVQAGLDAGTLPIARRRERSLGPLRVGHVALVGGGPGDPGLLTVRAHALLAAADVVITDRLGPRAALERLRPEVEIIDVGKHRDRHPVPQDRINELIVERASSGQDVVRLKGGDPFVLGRGGEEALHCARHGIAVEVVPGISSAVAVPAAAMIPVTHRGVATSFVVASAHDGADAALDALRDAPVDATLVLLMGVTALERTALSLIAAGRPAITPVAIIESGWTPQQRTTRTTLADAAATAAARGVKAPAVIVVGEVVGVADEIGRLLEQAITQVS